jgi:hypothetical protein
MDSAGTDQHGDAFAAVQHRCGALQVLGLGNRSGLAVTDPRVNGAVLVRRLLHRLQLLDVVGDDDTGGRARGAGDADRAVDQVADLRGAARYLHVLARHVLEQVQQVDLLLIVAPQRRAGLLADDRQHRLVVELGVVEAIEEMDGAGPGGHQADADLTRELGMGQAMKAAISSWRAWMNRILSCRAKAPSIPLMPSPG